jgi:hypothetical protein
MNKHRFPHPSEFEHPTLADYADFFAWALGKPTKYDTKGPSTKSKKQPYHNKKKRR